MAENKVQLILEAYDKTKEAFKRLEENLKGINTEGKKVDSGFTSITSSIKGNWLAVTAAVAGVVVAVKTVTEKINEAAHAGEELYTMSQQIGISVEAISGLSYAAKLSNISLEDLRVELSQFSQHIQAASQGGKDQIAIFQSLGIQYKDNHGKLKTMEEMLLDVADRFSRMENSVGKTALSMDLFGRSGAQIIPFLNHLGRIGIKDVTEEAKKMGRIISTDTAQAAEQFNNNITRLKTNLDGLKYSILNDVIPSINNLFRTFGLSKPGVEEQIDTYKRLLNEVRKEIFDLTLSKNPSQERLSALKMFEKRYEENLKNLGADKPKTTAPIVDKNAEEKEKKRKEELKNISDIMKDAYDREIILYADKNEQELIMLDIKQKKEIEDLKKNNATKEQIEELSSRHLREQGETSRKLQKKDDEEKLKRLSDIKDSEVQWEANMQAGIEERARRESELNKKSLEDKTEAIQKEREGRESEINLELSLIDLQEKEHGISKKDAVQDRVRLTQELLDIQQEHLDGMVKENDTTAWYAQADAIQKTQDKLVELNFEMKRQTGDFKEGFKYGLDDYIRNIKSKFDTAADLARTTAQSMESAFSDFFFDSMQGKLKSFSDYFNSFMLSVQRAIAQIMAQQTAQGIVAGVGSLFPGSSAGNGSPLGIDLWGKGGIGNKRHEGGQVVYIPKFHLGGLNSDESLTINKIGERYITREQNEWLTGMARTMQNKSNVNVVVNVENKTGMPITAKQTGVRFDGKQMVKNIILELKRTDPDFNAAMARGYY